MLKNLVGRAGKSAVPVAAIRKSKLAAWRKKQPKATQRWLDSTGFDAEFGKTALVPDRSGAVGRVVLGLGNKATPWAFAALGRLPKGRYALDATLDPKDADLAALGFGLSTYEFTRYRSSKRKLPSLAWPEGVDRPRVSAALEAIGMGRDLINTPASDLGPEQLSDAVAGLAKKHNAKFTVIVGDKLLQRGYPAIHAVGRASSSEPRLCDLRWGSSKAPKVTLVGKGVCFDTGGLDLKSAAGMKLMKKDMGGAASVIALAHMIMSAGLRVRLRVLVPAVENSVAGDAYRPGDVLSTRKGLSVEIGNTDAEGRLILCDALTEADSEDPEVLIDFATLTGAARIALGTELPALFCRDDVLARDVLTAGEAEHDPLWRMPLFDPYRRHLDSPIADLNNIASVGQGGAITAALFLREFVSKKRTWAHVDTMGWNSSSRVGRPQGGEVFGVRAFFGALEQRYA